MLRVAIVGCGKIADSHVAQILRLRGVDIVGVCDKEPLMARQLCERFPIRKWFPDLGQLLDEARPDVVHITTPPESHFDLAKQCLESDCHVYVEKPFTLHESEAHSLIELATTKGLKLTAGHDDQFSHVARRMRSVIGAGYLGGPPVHMESYYGYALGDVYARALIDDKRHWVRRLPGKLLHNIISHGIARIAEYLSTDSPSIMAYGFISPQLQRMGETEIIDELRVIISEQKGATAYFTFSSQMRPALHQFRIYGPDNGLVLDQDHETLIHLPGGRLKSYLEKFASPAILGKQYLGNVIANLGIFAKKDFHMKSGLKYLIEAFYSSIERGACPPIPYKELLLTARIMDRIFDQLNDDSPLAKAAPFADNLWVH